MPEKECDNHKWIPLLGMNKEKTVPTSLYTCLKCGDLKVGVETIKISRFRLDMGELPINNIAGIKLNNLPTADKTASGLIIDMTYGESIVKGDLLYFKSDGKVYKADATGSSTKFPVMGLALADASSGVNSVLLHGVYKDILRYDFSSGGVVYLATTLGGETQLQPASLNNVIQVVGIATSPDSIYFRPSADYLTHT